MVRVALSCCVGESGARERVPNAKPLTGSPLLLLHAAARPVSSRPAARRSARRTDATYSRDPAEIQPIARSPADLEARGDPLLVIVSIKPCGPRLASDAQRPLRLAAARDGERRERLRLGRYLASLHMRCDRPEPHGTQSAGVHTECTQRTVAEMSPRRSRGGAGM